MILAAGRGTRLGCTGLMMPKALVEVGGQPLLQSQIEYLAREGVERVVINAHHRAEAIERFVDRYRGSVSLTVIRERKLLGTAGGVRNALDVLGPEPFYVLYGDVVIKEPLVPIADAHLRTAAAATVTVYESHVVEGKGTVEVDKQGWIRRFAEKQTTARVPSLINAGLYLLEPSFVTEVPPRTEIDFGHDVFPAALALGSRVFAYKLSRPVIDVGTPEGLALARARAASLC
jgi:mannose-1-phosphate guanylyltransferase